MGGIAGVRSHRENMLSAPMAFKSIGMMYSIHPFILRVIGATMAEPKFGDNIRPIVGANN